jgi:aminoglycoside phosphotransferase (APT) family kinase protein
MTEYVNQLVDKDALEQYLAGTLGETDRFDVTYHQQGHSNETLFVIWGDRELVLRRPPPGETAESAHDVLREYYIYSRLEETPIPVPKTVLACEDPSVLSCDFYVMERVNGEVIDAKEPDRFAEPKFRKAISEEFIDTLTEIHTLDYEAAGLGELGRSDGFTERQVEKWTKQLNWAQSKTSDVRVINEFDRVGAWLEDNVPETYKHTLVHGDFTLDNTMFAPGIPPEIVTVLDWEMGTLGDPFTDLGWIFTMWPDPEDSEIETPELLPLSTITNRRGYLTRREFIERYEEQTGFRFQNVKFYRVFGVYKLAAVGEMFFARHLEGQSTDQLYPHMEEEVPRLADRALQIIKE